MCSILWHSMKTCINQMLLVSAKFENDVGGIYTAYFIYEFKLLICFINLIYRVFFTIFLLYVCYLCLKFGFQIRA